MVRVANRQITITKCTRAYQLRIVVESGRMVLQARD